MNKWALAGVGEFVGIILYTASDEFYGVGGFSDVAQMIGFGLPFALIGLLLGAVLFKKKEGE